MKRKKEMGKRIAEIYEETDGDMISVSIQFVEGKTIFEQLGILDFARTAIIAQSDRKIALGKYGVDEL